jgi:hypothetical protein
MADVIFQMPFRNYTAGQGAILPDEEALRLEAASVVRIAEDEDDAAAEIAAGPIDYVRPAVDLPPPPEPEPDFTEEQESDGTGEEMVEVEGDTLEDDEDETDWS